MAQANNTAGVDNTFRRKFDREEYLQRAREREEKELESHSKSKRPYEITTRWTMEMTFALLPWKPLLVFTGTSVMGINPENGKFCSHVDYWDSIKNNDYFSSEGLMDLIKQLRIYKTPDLETPKYHILKRTATYEDIPDMEGDKMHGIKSLALKVGETQVFWGCIWVLELAYVAAIFVGASSPVPWSKYVMIIGHMVMASVLWIRAKSVDLKDKDAIQSMYLVLWQLLSAEYCFFPLVR